MLLAASGFNQVEEDKKHGLDHEAWVIGTCQPLRVRTCQRCAAVAQSAGHGQGRRPKGGRQAWEV